MWPACAVTWAICYNIMCIMCIAFFRRVGDEINRCPIHLTPRPRRRDDLKNVCEKSGAMDGWPISAQGTFGSYTGGSSTSGALTIEDTSGEK